VLSDEISGKKILRDRSQAFRLSTCVWVRGLHGALPHLKTFLDSLPPGESDSRSPAERKKEMATKHRQLGSKAYAPMIEERARSAGKEGAALSDEDLAGLFELCRGRNRSPAVAAKWGMPEGSEAGLGDVDLTDLIIPEDFLVLPRPTGDAWLLPYMDV